MPRMLTQSRSQMGPFCTGGPRVAWKLGLRGSIDLHTIKKCASIVHSATYHTLYSIFHYNYFCSILIVCMRVAKYLGILFAMLLRQCSGWGRSCIRQQKVQFLGAITSHNYYSQTILLPRFTYTKSIDLSFHWDRDLLALLYEDWLSSGQCWAKSATYLNAIRSKEERKRGTFVMRDKTWLIEKYTEPVAKDIMQDKRAKQSARKTHDPIYVMDNPDLPGSEDPQLIYHNIYNICNIIYYCY